MSDLEKAQYVISKHQNDLAFILGNGVNKYTNQNVQLWSEMLLNIWNRYSHNKKTVNDIEGISLTEIFDILNLSTVEKQDAVDIFLREVKKMDHTGYHDFLQDKLQQLNVPVLTMNFDSLLERNLKRRRIKTNRKFTDYYPWETYWSNNKLTNPLDGFGIWHINGTAEYKRSIRLSLSHYTQLAARTKKLIHGNSPIDTFDMNKGKKWAGMDTWFHIFFNKSLMILGLNLDKDETFLRWLLIERKKYFENSLKRSKNGWYICQTSEIKKTPGKEMFLEGVGFEVLKIDNFDDIYKNIFK